MSFTTVQDIATDLGRSVVPPETSQIQSWIDTVEGRVRQRIPNLSELVADPSYLATLKGVVVEIVVAKVNNPKGLDRENIDDYGYGMRRDLRSPDLRLTDDDWAELIPEYISEAFSTRPSFEPDWCAPW